MSETNQVESADDAARRFAIRVIELETDRDALVRYVRVGKGIADGEEYYTGRSSQNDYDALLEELCSQLNEAYKALSQELRDLIGG